MAEALVEDENAKREDRVYLLIFELWRRLASHKPSLSIFCDELDYIISRFEEDEDDNLEMNLEAVGEVQPDNPLQFIHNYNLRGVITTIIFYILNSMTDEFVDKTSFFNLQIRLFLAFIVHIVIVSYIIQNRKELF